MFLGECQVALTQAEVQTERILWKLVELLGMRIVDRVLVDPAFFFSGFP